MLTKFISFIDAYNIIIEYDKVYHTYIYIYIYIYFSNKITSKYLLLLLILFF